MAFTVQIDMTGSHDHDEECFALARAQIALLRASITMNEAIISAHDSYIDEARAIISALERLLVRRNVAELTRMLPGLSPPTLTRQTNRAYGPSRRPLRDITNTHSN